MARRARAVSISGIYHVVFKGVNRQLIFETDHDRKSFLGILKRCKEADGFEVIAYCLMGNHVHLIIRTQEKTIGAVMNRLLTSYAGWFNWKYKRQGHLFQDRFFSEAIEDKDYLLTAWRYVLHNPMNAGLEEEPGRVYKWSSIFAYMGTDDGITDTALVASCFASFDRMLKYIYGSGRDDGIRMMIERGDRLTDDAVAFLLKEISGCLSISDFQQLDKEVKIQCMRQVYQKYRVSVAQLSRVSGMAFRTIRGRLGTDPAR